jgi:hypothetical protein
VSAVSVYVSVGGGGGGNVQVSVFSDSLNTAIAGSSPLHVEGPFEGWITLPLMDRAVGGALFPDPAGYYRWVPGDTGWVGVSVDSTLRYGADGGTGGKKLANLGDSITAAPSGPVPAAFVLAFGLWQPPVISDEDLAAYGWTDTQQALAGAVDSHTNISTTAEWHGTNLDDNLGAFAVVREGGSCEDLVGDVIKVTAGGRVVYAYVTDSSDELDADVSLTRRGFAALGPLSLDQLAVRVEVVQGATTG